MKRSELELTSESKKSESGLEKWKKIKGLKKEQLLIILLFGILLIVITIPAEPLHDNKLEKKESSDTTAQEVFSGEMQKENTYERKQELRLKEVLQQVEGVGRTEVMITLQASAELVVEKDMPVSRQTIEETDAQGGQRHTAEENLSEETIYQEHEDGTRTPYVVKQLEPTVEGVIVIAEGGGNAEIKQHILEAVQALFPVEAHKIKIMKMEGSK